MIQIKSESEIIKIKKAGKILAKVRLVIINFIRPGISTNEIDSLANKLTVELGAKPSFLGYEGFPKTICVSNNETLIHGIPNDQKLKDYDLLSIDMGVEYKGYHADSAFTMSVGKSDEENKVLITVAEQAFFEGFKAIKPGARVGDISAAIGNYIKAAGYFTPDEFSGHGIGANLHEMPYINNDGRPDSGPLLRNNMVICIEPMILQKSKKVKTLKDG
jgi:methionyl aminopeptidase